MIRRAAAFTVDGALCSMPFVIIAPVAFKIGGSVEGQMIHQMAVFLGAAFSLVLYGIVNLIQTFRGAQTPGQKVAHLRRVAAGSPKNTAIIRGMIGLIFIVAILTLPPVALLFPAWILLDKNSLSPLDRICKTEFQKI